MGKTTCVELIHKARYYQNQYLELEDEALSVLRRRFPAAKNAYRIYANYNPRSRNNMGA